MSKYYFNSNLLRLLGCSQNKTYSMDEIESIVERKKLKGCDVKIYFPDYPTCSCTNCEIVPSEFIKYIKKKLILNINKPTCEYFEHNQKPVQVLSIEVD